MRVEGVAAAQGLRLGLRERLIRVRVTSIGFGLGFSLGFGFGFGFGFGLGLGLGLGLTLGARLPLLTLLEDVLA